MKSLLLGQDMPLFTSLNESTGVVKRLAKLPHLCMWVKLYLMQFSRPKF